MDVYFAVARQVEEPAGWGKFLALVITGLLAWAAITIHQRWLKSKETPSPTAAVEGGQKGVKVQARVGSEPNVNPPTVGAPKGVKDLDVFVSEHLATHRPAQIIREARARYRSSKSSVKRAINRARAKAQP